RVLDEIAASDQFVERRQLGCLDVTGRGAGGTGAGNRPWAGHRVDRNVVVAANAVVGEKVADAMFDTFSGGADLTLWERLLRSLEAGKAAGGQPDGETSGGLYVVDREPYPMVDLRVDFHPTPVAELRRLADAYFPLVSYYQLRPRDPSVPRAAEWLAAQKRGRERVAGPGRRARLEPAAAAGHGRNYAANSPGSDDAVRRAPARRPG